MLFLFRRFTIGRAFALLILGVAIGVGLYIARHLQPDVLKAQFKEALKEVLAPGVKYAIEDVGIDLDTGVEILGLRVYYDEDRKWTALEVERIALHIDHQELLSGDVNIKQVDIYGLVVRLLPDPEQPNLPSMPGIFRQTRKTQLNLPKRLPVIRIHPGTKTQSGLELVNTRLFAKGVGIRLDCVTAEAEHDGNRYSLVAKFQGERVDNLTLRLDLDPADGGRLDIEAEADLLHWEREDIHQLTQAVRDELPPAEVAGEAHEIRAFAQVDLEKQQIVLKSASAQLKALEGRFGNIHTGERAGLPFRVHDGSASVSYVDEDGHLRVPDFTATYESPDGVRGQLDAKLDIDMKQEGYLDFDLKGRRLRASIDDLRQLLEPEIVETLVEQFLPAGTFDLDLNVKQRPGEPERVEANLKMMDGEFNYAGRLDELTGKRFGFRYALDRCNARLRIKTAVPTPRGLAQTIEIVEMSGFSRIQKRGAADGPDNVAVTAYGQVRIWDNPGDVHREDVNVHIDVREMPIDSKLATAFASTPRGMPYEAFDLSGWAESLHIHVERAGFGDNEPRASYAVVLRDCSMAYREFPLRVGGISGRVVSRDLLPERDGQRGRIMKISLKGKAAGGDVTVHEGTVRQTDEGTEDLDVTIQATGLSVGPELERALLDAPGVSAEVTDLWAKLRPGGRLDARVKVRSVAEPEVDLFLEGETTLAGYGKIDCPVSDLRGKVRYHDGTVTVEGITGRVLESPFTLTGSVHTDGRFDFRAAVDRLVLERRIRELLAAVAPEAYAAVELLVLDDASVCDLTLSAAGAGGDAPVRMGASVDGLELVTRARGLHSTIRGGPIDFEEDAIRARELRLRDGDGEMRIRDLVLPKDLLRPGTAVVDARNLDPALHLDKLFGGGFLEVLGHNLRIDLKGLQVELDRNERTVVLTGAADLRRHRLLDDEVDALEPTGALGLNTVTLLMPAGDGPVRFQGEIEFNGLNMNLPVRVRDMSGALLVAEGTLTPEFTLEGALTRVQATLFDRYFDELAANLSIQPHFLRLNHIEGRFYKGRCRGDLEVHMVEPSAFKVSARVENVDLGEMLKEDMPREPMSGTLHAAVEIESASGEIEHQRGRGQIRIGEGQLFRVPGLRRILAVLERVAPLGGKRFERAEVDFTVDGENLEVSRLHLATNLNDVHGRGRITIYGDLDLVVEPQVTKMIDLPRIINLPVLSTLRDLWHRTVYEIRLEGTIDSPGVRLRALPWIRKARKPFTQSPHAGRAERIRPRLLP